MKTAITLLLTLVASAIAFAPSGGNARVSTELSAKSPFATLLSKKEKKTTTERKPFFESVFGMDLFAPNSTVNEYGARSKKKLVQGKINGGKSYVPAGLTASQYSKIRSAQQAKKEANYNRNAAKAGKFQDYTDFYKKRGTDTTAGWIKGVTRGHTMAKTKYDWSGDSDKKLWAKKTK